MTPCAMGEMAEGRDRTTGDYNDFWAGRDYLNVTDKIEAAVLMAHAFKRLERDAGTQCPNR